MTNVLIADDHPMVRAGLRRFLEQDSAFSSIGEAASVQETLERLRSHGWQVLLLDLHLPDGSGLDILSCAQSERIATKILVLSALPERQYALSVLKAGAQGYLQKECSPEQLIDAIHEILRGGRYLSADLAGLLLGRFDQTAATPLHHALTVREFQVFRHLALGKNVVAQARELGISQKTVSTYRKRIFEKMGFETNADLTMYAVRNGLVP